ncbi:hypothetical protein FRE64_16880 (plasmid) [Euhalothece natronophila Z-M001]|uniref:Uncharacterized protein n=1 Tax=Euhalothece natronophila Z-M001 TaxID=522448 RepID=A0A5B8NRJ5_9CHRO|nr:hypothetical protein [Euhalothece natronophila]QDZ41648.1 hypothetical protein FRE64_16880 [Euhalothece natronophila Z-M001]
MNKRERNRLIKQISHASGIAQYALKQKMTDEEVSEAAKNLKVLALIKSANTYNRYCQAQKTKEANDKLKAFLDPKNSEIISAGKWLLNALSKEGKERQNTLLEKDLVHKEDYNATTSDLRDTISTIENVARESTQQSAEKIRILEKRIDTLQKQLSSIQKYIQNNYGAQVWKDIRSKFISKV